MLIGQEENRNANRSWLFNQVTLKLRKNGEGEKEEEREEREERRNVWSKERKGVEKKRNKMKKKEKERMEMKHKIPNLEIFPYLDSLFGVFLGEKKGEEKERKRERE